MAVPSSLAGVTGKGGSEGSLQGWFLKMVPQYPPNTVSWKGPQWWTSWFSSKPVNAQYSCSRHCFDTQHPFLHLWVTVSEILRNPLSLFTPSIIRCPLGCLWESHLANQSTVSLWPFDWFRDSHVTQSWPINIELRTFVHTGEGENVLFPLGLKQRGCQLGTLN